MKYKALNRELLVQICFKPYQYFSVGKENDVQSGIISAKDLIAKPLTTISYVMILISCGLISTSTSKSVFHTCDAKNDMLFQYS